MIQPAEIARLAHRLGLGDKTIEKDYALTWTLLAVADSPLRDRLAFKGGTALKKVYVPEYRFSEDLDFTLLAEMSNDVLCGDCAQRVALGCDQPGATSALRPYGTALNRGNPCEIGS